MSDELVQKSLNRENRMSFTVLMLQVFFSDLNAPKSAPNCSNSSVHRDDVGVATRGGSGATSAKAAARIQNRRTERQRGREFSKAE